MVIMMLGGYYGSSPTITVERFATVQICENVAAQVRQKFMASGGQSGKSYKEAPSFIQVECIEIRP
jgi:hypothetical protein